MSGLSRRLTANQSIDEAGGKRIAAGYIHNVGSASQSDRYRLPMRHLHAWLAVKWLT